MKTIEVLGPGCQRCLALYELTKMALRNLGVECEVKKVEDMKEIMARKILLTPALVVDGKLVLRGHVPPLQELTQILVNILAAEETDSTGAKEQH